jgi:uncharacterized phage protein (TIGR01671 family)
MKREIKFRAWDNVEKKFFEPIYEAYKGRLLDLSITLAGQLIRRTILKPVEYESCFPDRYVLMQFTGLQDRNGVEIYEGDILQNFFDEQLFNWLVVFRDGCFGIQNIGVNGYLGHFYSANSTYYFTERVVIGNIYDNPELLK